MHNKHLKTGTGGNVLLDNNNNYSLHLQLYLMFTSVLMFALQYLFKAVKLENSNTHSGSALIRKTGIHLHTFITRKNRNSSARALQ